MNFLLLVRMHCRALGIKIPLPPPRCVREFGCRWGVQIVLARIVARVRSRFGVQVVVITAKDKLRRLLGHGNEGGISLSTELPGGCTMDENGIEDVLDLGGAPQPDVYSAELSLFVMEAGIRILERDRPTIMYLSLTDYIQHKYAPGSPESDSFYKAIDAAAGRLADLGAVVGLTADHGMNDKSAADGSPNVVY